MKADTPFITVENYIGQFSQDVQDILWNIFKIISENAPEAIPCISYAMPAFKLNNKVVMYFAAYEKHIGIYAIPETHIAFSEELKQYKQGKGSFQIPLNEPVPYKLLAQMVQFRVLEIKNTKKSKK